MDDSPPPAPAGPKTRILAISGSLRAESVNTALLRHATSAAPSDIDVALSACIGDLPLFNPDLEAADPAPVRILREQIIAADALLIASPEYAHGVSGALKNALDWMVGNESFVHKPVALLNAGPRASHAQAALREIVRTMSARIVEPACQSIEGSLVVRRGTVVDRVAADATLLAILRALQAAVRAAPADDPP
jgi:chromate reductase